MTPSYIILNYLTVSQSLFYWIIYSYSHENASDRLRMYESLNPYFIGLSILIDVIFNILARGSQGLNPYFIGLSILIFQRSRFSNYEYYYVSILILLDYLFLSFNNVSLT